MTAPVARLRHGRSGQSSRSAGQSTRARSPRSESRGTPARPSTRRSSRSDQALPTAFPPADTALSPRPSGACTTTKG
ncbi:hypothetical protein FHS36_002583 [Streptomyces eurocidicus]|uniref:Uncharacterized protein n=1 Tax=Streptomyces eurocidicus TaxID=66423 RepID=A0A7W8F2T0_STREU|nr:hypothetical protein [Streptomyces eurocidicus]